jgi:WD40 repeat protein
MVLSLAVSPDANTVVSSGIDSQLRFWDASSGRPATSIGAENARIRSMVFDSQGTSLVVGGQWRTRIWNMRELSAPPRDVGASEEISDLHLSPDGRMLATATSASALRMWDLEADARVNHWQAPESGIVGISIREEDSAVVAGARTTFATLQSEEPVRVISTVAMPGATVMAGTPDGRWVATTGYPKTSAIWDAVTGQRTADLTVRTTSRALTFADEGRRVAIGETTGEIRVWELASGTLGRELTIPTGGSEVLWLVARGTTLFAAHRDRVVVQRDIVTGREVRRFQTAASPFSLALTPDGRQLLIGTYSGVTEIWDLAAGSRRVELKGQTSIIHAVSVSPDGKLVATSSRDGSTRLWSIEGQFLATISTHHAAATRNQFFPDSRRLAIGYEDGELEVMSLDYFFRHAAGQAEYRLRIFRQAGESFPRAHEVLAWARGVLSK